VGEKRIETRSWPTLYRGPLGIHAGKYLPQNVEERRCYESLLRQSRALFDMTLSDLPYGAMVATAILTDCIKMDEEYVESMQGTREFELGWFAPGRYAFVLADIVQFSKPTPIGGKQGLWDWGTI